MSARQSWTVTIEVGSRLSHDGELWTVVGMEAGCVVLSGARGSRKRVLTATLLADPTTRLLGAEPAAPLPVGSLFDDLSESEREQLWERLGHVREVLTGYRSGCAELAGPGEPRPEYDPSLPQKERYRLKAAELGVGSRTIERWVAALREAGPIGLVDGRSVRPADPLAGVDARWLTACRGVLEEHTDASRPTRQLLLERIAARLDAEYGPGQVTPPGEKKARAVLDELTRGTNAFVGATKQKRSIAARPSGVYGRLRATRPGEYLLLDTTPLDVFAMEPLTLRWVGVELTIAMDLFSRTICGLRLSAMSTKAVDAAVVLFETLTPASKHTTGTGLLPYGGLPEVIVVDADTAQFAKATKTGRDSNGGLPGVAAETLVVDHGKIYLSEHVLAVCERLGISIQPARPLTPTDKAAVERFFRTLREGLLVALPGYKGPDVYSRGADPEGCSYFFIDELERIIREWTAGIYHRRPHEGLVEPGAPGVVFSPAEMFEAGIARAGLLRIPAHPGLVFDFLPTAWRTIQHYGVELHGLRYNGPALNPYRNRTSPHTGVHAGRWPVRYDPDDISKVYFCDPADHSWHTLAWEHAEDIGVPFSAETLAYARRLALASGRHVDERHALAELLERFGAGLVRNPVERRLALRASEQRQARLAAQLGTSDAAEVAALPSLSVISGQLGDDDSAAELDLDDDMSDEEFYADALEDPAVSAKTAALVDVDERDWNPSSKTGWFAMVEAPPRSRPPARTGEQLAAMGPNERLAYDQARAIWHANIGPVRTPQVDALFEALDEIVGANRQDGDKVKPTAVLDALPGLGKTTAALAFGAAFHRAHVDLYGPQIDGGGGSWQRIPVVYVGLTSNTTMRSLNARLCRFYGLPGADRGTADWLANRAAECVANCKTRLIIVDDVHFLDVNRRDGREVANHFKWLANTFPVTFFFVGVGLRARGLLDEGLCGADAAFSQTARRWSVLSLDPFEIATKQGRNTWRQLLLSIERELVLANAHRGMVARDLSDYLFARSSGHFASLMSLISRGCYRAVKTRAEALTVELLDRVRIDEAAEAAREQLHAALDAGVVSTNAGAVRRKGAA